MLTNSCLTMNSTETPAPDDSDFSTNFEWRWNVSLVVKVWIYKLPSLNPTASQTLKLNYFWLKSFSMSW